MAYADNYRVISRDVDEPDYSEFYKALGERINAHEQAAATAGPPLSSPNATTFAPNVGGSPLNYEDPYLRGGASQHPGTGVESIMPWQRQGVGPQGNPYQREEGPVANAPFTDWRNQEPQGLSQAPHSMMQPASYYMQNMYKGVGQTKKSNWNDLLQYLSYLTDPNKGLK